MRLVEAGWSLAVMVAGCGLDFADVCSERAARPGEARACVTPGWTDRAFDLHVPDGWDGVAALPTVLLLHGGGGSRLGSDRTTCAAGDLASPNCLVAQATARGFAVVVPDGTGSRPLRGLRTWNAGGGHDGWNCTSGAACASAVDDLAYFADVLAEVGAAVPLDERRVFATGISNGGAMAHRLACELTPALAAIAPVGGANQHADTGGACAATVAVLQLHGTADPCWAYDGGAANCLGDAAPKTSVASTMAGWRQRNRCAATFTDTAIADRDPADGVTAVRRVWDGCAIATELIRLDGGGHTWPGGWQYLGADTIGPVARDLDSAVILDFFAGHARP